MRSNTTVVALAILGLFVASILIGYVAGEKYFRPRQRPTPEAALPSPPRTQGGVEAPPPTVPPGPPGAATPRLRPVPMTPLPPAPETPGAPAPAATPAAQVTPTPTASPVQTVARPRPTQVTETRTEPTGVLYRVQVGAFADRSNASELVARLLADGFTAYIVRDGGLLKVRVAAFRDRAPAEELAARLRAKGYAVAIIH